MKPYAAPLDELMVAKTKSTAKKQQEIKALCY